MAHNLEQDNAGNVAFALRGAPAWHGLAQNTWDADAKVTTAEMLDGAFLSNWNVQLEQVIVPEGYNMTNPSYMVVRDNPFTQQQKDVLAVVGDRYHTYQNEELFAFGDNLLDGGGFWESAGSIRDGRTVFGSLQLGKDIVLDKAGIADVTKSYLLVTTSHDGSSAIQAMTTPVRVVCQNTLNMALNGCKQSFKVRHTATAKDRVQQAREALGISFAYLDQFEVEANAMFAQSVTDKQFGEIIEALYPTPDRATAGKAVLTKYDDKSDIMWDLWRGPTQLGIKGTAWGALNALTERVDYHRAGRKGTNTGILASASGFDAQVNAEKQRIKRAVLEVAGL
jgi:phage/plasmid-like protein (TIGR03299 family)